jgi:hypothetical protein
MLLVVVHLLLLLLVVQQSSELLAGELQQGPQQQAAAGLAARWPCWQAQCRSSGVLSSSRATCWPYSSSLRG